MDRETLEQLSAAIKKATDALIHIAKVWADISAPAMKQLLDYADQLAAYQRADSLALERWEGDGGYVGQSRFA